MTILLRCVECKSPGLAVAADGRARCAKCGAEYPAHAQTKSPILIAHGSTLKSEPLVHAPVSALQGGVRAAQWHWATGGLVQLLESCSGKQLLNYGSGDGGDFLWLKARGYEVTTFDVYPGAYTHFICDGHDLCFADAQFDIVTSLAVFEHLYDPFAAAREIFRVLKPGGALVGSVAFLEPFHAQSYFHMTHLGIREVLQKAGFANIELRPGWSSLEALSSSFWPLHRVKVLRAINGYCKRALYRFGLWQWRLAYKLRGKQPPPDLDLTYCGSIIFKAEKPASS